MYGHGKIKRMIPRVLALFFCLTYIVLFVDVLVEHHIGLAPPTLAKLIPIIFSFLASGISLVAALWPRRDTLILFTVTMGFSVLIGSLGAYFHMAGNLDNITLRTLHILPPKLAPLAFSGIGIIGVLISFGLLYPSLEKNELVYDPVCGRQFPRSMAAAVVRTNGHIYYLCCPLCERWFRNGVRVIRQRT